MNPNKSVVPNVSLRLFSREIGGHRGHPVHTARQFSECILPTEKVLEVESPDAHIGRFTPDGRFLVCFSLQLQAVLLYDYLGPVPQPHPNPNEAIGFNRFFKERFRLNLCHGTELLNRDFCLTLENGAYLLLASCTPLGREGPAAAAGTTGARIPTAAAAAAAPEAVAGDTQRQQQLGYVGDEQQHAAAVPGASGFSEVGDVSLRGQRSASSGWCEMTTFHLIDIQRGMKLDERKFPSDYFELAGNACVSLYDNTLALTSLYTQTIHLLQVGLEGSLVNMQSIGRTCQDDDLLPIQLAAAAEQQWQLQQQQMRRKLQQEHLEAASQQQLFVHMSQVHRQQQQQQEEPQQQQQQQNTGAGNGITPDSQQLQQQLLQRVTHPNSRWGQAAAAAIGAAAAAHPGGNRSDSESSEDGMDRRERRRRVPAARQPAAAAAGPRQMAAAARQHDRLSPEIGNPQQQQQEEQQQLLLLDPLAAPGPPTRATATASASAVLDPQHHLIEGIQQRLLAYLFKAIAQQRPNEVAPSMWDFQYNFGALSALCIYRARFLDRQHLLLKLAAPTSGSASAAELNPNRTHFFAVYDIVTTCFDGFWKASNGRLLSAVMAQPSQLLAAGQDVSPWERCSAEALYPPGYPLDVASSTRQRQRPEEGHRASGGQSSGSRSSRLQDRSGVQQQQQQQPGATPTVAETAPRDGGQGATGAAAGARIVAALAESAAADADDVVDPSSSSSSSKAAKDRLKLLRQVVLLVLPGLQNLSSSPYLDPHLFRYSKHISPIMGLRNSPAEPLKFELARAYAGFEPRPSLPTMEDQQESGRGDEHAELLLQPQQPSPNANSRSGEVLQQQQQQQQQQHQQQDGAIFELDPARPHSVTWGNEEVARRQLHLFHPSDPFVLTVVQTIAQPAAISIYYRGRVLT